MSRGLWLASAALALAAAHPGIPARAQVAAAPNGLQEPAYAPDGRRVAVSYFDRIWTMAPDGRQARALVPGNARALEREPAWSPDGQRVAFAADRGRGFDIFVAPARGGDALAVTTLAGDERWPSWTPDGRLVFAHRPAAPAGSVQVGAPFDLYLSHPVPGSGAWQPPVPLTETPLVTEIHPRAAPDGSRVAFVSDRDAEDDVDVWVMALPRAAVTKPVPLGAATAGRSDAERAPRPQRVTRARGSEAFLTWAPDSARLAFYAVRENVGSVWVAPVDAVAEPGDEQAPRRPRPSAPPQLVSRRGGAPAWSPDGDTLLVAGLPDPQPVYNGNPARDETEPPPVFAAGNAAFSLWRVPAPAPVDEHGAVVEVDLQPARDTLVSLFDRSWQLLRTLYYAAGPSAAAWESARETFRPRALRAANARELEDVVDAMVAQQPLIKPMVTSAGAVIVSGHALASEAGRRAIERGGNVVDAAVAVSFALGVVEPEASGIGGDGSAVLFLQGMPRPTVVDYKDQTPIRATADNRAIVQDGRIVADGPAAANIPGVVAGLELLHRRYGSGKVAWADLIAPAITLAEDGFVLDEALPTSIAEGRRFLEKYPEAARIYLPGGKVPQPGDTFVNKDYAETLRILAKEGGESFYRGSIARRIAADLEANGGILSYADLAQYRAIERAPISGRYRGHVLYAGGPPVSTGIQLFESLHILEHFTPAPAARTARDADYLHHAIEAWKVRDQVRRVADPERWPVDFDEHLSAEHARKAFLKIDPRKASQLERPTPEDAPAAPPARIGTGTTSFAVADAHGNMIAVTQTLSTWGGTFYVSKGLGFLYNNHLRSNRLAAGTYGSLTPLMRSSTASAPTLVFRKSADRETPRLAVGAAGNAWIPVSVYSIVTAVIDGELGAQAAVEAPRFLPGRDPASPTEREARVEIEDRFPRSLLDDLTQRGHRFQKIGRKGEVRYGYASAVLVDTAAGRVEGGAEPRRSHAAVAASTRALTNR